MHDAILLEYKVVHPPDEPPHVRDPDKDPKKDADPNRMYDGNKAFLEWSMVSAAVSNLERDRMIGWEEKSLYICYKINLQEL